MCVVKGKLKFSCYCWLVCRGKTQDLYIPSLSIFRVSDESHDGIWSGTISCLPAWTLADARQRIHELQLFDFEYDFVDDKSKCRIPIAWEKGNLVQDFEGKISIKSKDVAPNTKSGGNC